MGAGRALWVCLVWICVALSHGANRNGVGVSAFQSMKPGFPSPACVTGSNRRGVQRRFSGAGPLNWIRDQNIKSHSRVLHGMNEKDESSPPKASKRKKINKSLGKIISYTKHKLEVVLDKIWGKDGDSTQLNRKSNKIHANTDRDVTDIAISDVPGEIVDRISSESYAAEEKAAAISHDDLELATMNNANPILNAQKQRTFVRSATTLSVDLSGKWELVGSEDFKTSYDKYLKLLGQPVMVRAVALSIIGMTTEETVQSDQGRQLKICGRNFRGMWERILVASSEDDPMVIPIVTSDDETVQAECWWEENGSVHRSWLRGVEKYGGGSFESIRYLEENGQVLVCESTFHPSDPSREKACVTWKFRRLKEQA